MAYVAANAMPVAGLDRQTARKRSKYEGPRCLPKV